MAWLAVISGADGVGLFDWDERTKDPQTGEFKGWHTREHPEQVENVRVVFQELRALEVVLLTPKAVLPPQLQPANPALHVLVKAGHGRRFLLVANDSRRPETATLTLPGAADGQLHSLGAGQAPIPFRNGALLLELPPLGVALYEFR